MSVFNKSSNPLESPAELESHIEQALAVEAPGGINVGITYRLIKSIFNPVILGADNVPDKPCLFVGNHSLFALDGMIIGPVFLNELRRFPRPMGDRFLFGNKLAAQLLMKNGIVMGHPEVCSALMKDGQDLLVFPGGAYEAVKPASEKYKLQWKERVGFVTLAALHGYTIMPFGLVGPDEFYRHMLEGRDLPHSALGKLLTQLGILHDEIRNDIIPPLPVGSLGTLIPKPQRCYLGFGQPINLSRHRGKKLNKKSLGAIRTKVAGEIEQQLTDLLLLREQQKGNDSLLRRLLTL